VTQSGSTSAPSTSLYQRFYEVVRRIPPGRVATYGQVARVAGYPGYARQVGYALFRLQGQNTDIPWHRVINAQGCISYSPFRLGYDDLQKALLQAEGIHFDAEGQVDLQQFGWDPWEA